MSSTGFGLAIGLFLLRTVAVGGLSGASAAAAGPAPFSPSSASATSGLRMSFTFWRDKRILDAY